MGKGVELTTTKYLIHASKEAYYGKRCRINYN